jgi:hypothetical protein
MIHRYSVRPADRIGLVFVTALPRVRVALEFYVVLLAGFAAMYAPVYWSAANGIWQTDENAHGAIIMALVFWLFWRKSSDIDRSSPE